VSVRLSHSPASAGLLLWAQRAGDIDHLLHDWHHSSMGLQHSEQRQIMTVFHYGCGKGLPSTRKFNMEDAMDHRRQRKLIKDV